MVGRNSIPVLQETGGHVVVFLLQNLLFADLGPRFVLELRATRSSEQGGRTMRPGHSLLQMRRRRALASMVDSCHGAYGSDRDSGEAIPGLIWDSVAR